MITKEHKRTSKQLLKPIFTSLVPLIITGICYFLENLVSYLGSKNYQDLPVILEDIGDFSQERSTKAMIVLILQQFRICFMDIYNDYFVFLTVMMILHFIIHHFRETSNQSRKNNSHIENTDEITSLSKSQNKMKNVLILIISYTICFYFIKFVGVLISTYFLIPANENQSQVIFPSQDSQVFRHLKEERMLAVQRPLYFKEISEVYFDELFPFYMYLSNDLQTAFVVQVNAVDVYNVSDPTHPKKIGSYIQNSIHYPSSVLSPNNKILVVDAGAVDIFNVTDRSDPNVIGHIQVRTEEELKAFSNLNNPTVAISPDDRYIIVSDPKMRIYDISDLGTPKLIFEDPWRTTAVLMSADGQNAFVGGHLSFRIFDVSDFAKPKLLSDVPTSGHVFTLTFSKDQKTIYVLCGSLHQGEALADLILEIYDITNPSYPFEKQAHLTLTTTRDVVLSSLTVSPDGTFLALKNMNSMKILNLRTNQVASFMTGDIRFPNIAFFPNGKNALIFSVGLIRFVEVYLNIPEDHSSSLQPNYLAQLVLESLPKQIAVLSSNKRGFILSSTDSGSFLLSIDLRDYSFARIVQTFDASKNLTLFTLSSDGKNIYYKSSQKTLQVLNIQQETGELSKVAVLKLDEDLRSMFLVSSDQKTLFTVLGDNNGNLTKISLYDISADPKLISNVSFGALLPDYFFEFDRVYMALSGDEKTLFYLDQRLFIIDISDKANPRFINIFNYGHYLTKTFAFSSDFKTCYILATPYLDKKLLITINITEYRNPEVLSITDLPFDSNFQLVVSRDDKQLFVSSSGALITLDISNKTSIRIADTQLIKVSTFMPIGENILIGNENGLQVINRKPKYALEMSNHKFSLGKVHSNPVRVLELKRNSNYSTIEQNYKFVHASLYSGEIKPLKEFLVSYPVLPSWIYFDKDNALLNLDLTQSINVTSYKIRFSISTEVLATDFLQIKDANYTQDDVQNLQAYLFGQGYLDSERYLTGNFDANTPLLLKTKYGKFEQDIRKILKSHSIEIITPILLESSLQLRQTKPFQIITPSLNFVHVEIKLGSPQTKFVSQAFSAVKTNLDDNKTVLTLEGASLYINEAFQKLLVNLEDESTSCEGSIHVSDGLNPPILENFGNMSRFIETNKKPQMLPKYSVQGQVDKVGIIAGEHFNIEFDEMTFFDLNNRSLIYSLEMPDENMEVPAWITLRGRTLMGTPPEQFWIYEKEFCLKASNEYKSEAIVFKFQVGLSYLTILKRVLFLMGYLFTAYKSWQHSDKFYNIFCKKRYQYAKVIHTDAGKEITKNEILPILMISKRVQKLNKVVLNAIRQYIGQGKAACDEMLLEYFVDSESGSFNRSILTGVIDNLVLKNPIGKNKEVIEQLIANELTMKRIKSEKATLDIFEKIKSRWINLVEIDQASFAIKYANFTQELRTHDLNIDESSLDNSSDLLTSSTKRSLLIPSPRVNMGLLKDAILAYAFEKQNIWRSRYRIRIRSKELMEHATSNYLKRFLKFDTIDLVQDSSKQLGHGLKFEFIGDQMVFYGKLKEQMKNKTLIVQITTKRGWILRELKIQGASARGLNDQRRTIDFIQEEL